MTLKPSFLPRLFPALRMCDHLASRVRSILHPRSFLILSVLFVSLIISGCGVLGVKNKINVPALLSPLADADTTQLIAEVNRLASIRSIRGKIDIQFLDTSFAQCGIAEKYRTADGTIVIQRPGQIFLIIKVPFVGQDIAQMASDGERFRVAVLMGEERHRRFLRGTNAATYARVNAGQEAAAQADCGDDGKNKAANERRAVSALSGLRPQHFTDALLIRPIDQDQKDRIYVRTESFEEEADSRPKAKNNSRVVRGYYLLDEIALDNANRWRTLRRFWFDRYNSVRLARLQTFDDQGLLATDVYFADQKRFGADGQHLLPGRVVLTRPQDRYSLSVTYQAPESVVLNSSIPADVFNLENKSQLPEVDLDSKRTEASNSKQ